MKRIGIDVGGTKIIAAIIDDGKIIKEIEVKTDKSNLVQQLVNLVRQLDVKLSVGIGCAGQIDQGIIKHSPNLNLTNFPLQKLLEKEVNTSISLINDVQAAALGELLYGYGKVVERFIVCSLGTGIGGAIIDNGHIFTGTAGEIGHIVVIQGGNICTCGNKGCLEAYSGGWALAKNANVENGQKAFENKDALDQAYQCLVTGFTTLNNLLNPEVILLGGNLLNGYKEHISGFLDKLELDVRGHSIKTAGPPLRILEGKLASKAALIGSAYIDSQN